MRRILASGEACPTGTTDDFLFMLRCDEAAAANDLTDALAVRTMTQTANPPTAADLIGWDETTGARDFNGTTQYAGRAAATGDETLLQSGEFGFGCWLVADTLAAAMTVIEYGEFSSPETAVTNVQFALQVLTSGRLRLQHENGVGVNVNTDSPTTAAVVVAGQRHHVGISVGPDPTAHDLWRVRHYLDGKCIAQTDGVAPPTGGSTARWIVGASRAGGAAVGTPGQFFDGRLDDIVLCKFTPEHDFFRDLYGAGVRDFEPSQFQNASGIQNYDESEAYFRVLIETDVSEFTEIAKVNLTDVDLSDIADINFIRGIRLNDSVDALMASMMVTCHARYGFWNLSPFVPDTQQALVIGENALDGLLKPARRIKAEIAVMPAGNAGCGIDANNPGDLHPFFQLIFDGYITSVKPDGEKCVISALDRGRALQWTNIEPDKTGQDRTYGDAAATTSVESVLQKIVDDNDPRVFDILSIDDVAGVTLDIIVLRTSAALGEGKAHPMQSPDPIKIAGTVNFNGTFTVANTTTSTNVKTTTAPGAFAAETVGSVTAVRTLGYFGGKPSVYTPVSPGWNLYEFPLQASTNVLEAIDGVVNDNIGYRCRYRYDNVRRCFRLTLFDPAASPVFLNVNANYYAMEGLAINDERLRNTGVTEYADDGNLDPVNERPRYLVSSRDVSSIREFGRRYFRIAVGAQSLVTRSNEAQTLTDNVVDTLKRPDATGNCVMPLTHEPDPGDAGSFQGENVNNLSETTVLTSGVDGLFWAAIAEVAHEIEVGAFKTTLALAKVDATMSRSISRRSSYTELIAQRGAVPSMGTLKGITPSAPTVSYLGALNAIRTVLVKWSWPWTQKGRVDLNRAYDGTEIHRHDNTGAGAAFVPDSTTLIGVVRGTHLLVASNTTWAAATTYQVKLVHRDRLRGRSAASAATAIAIP
jgi:hypothetical protein